MTRLGILLIFAITAVASKAQHSSGPLTGTLIVDGGGTTQPIIDEFVRMAGGAEARIVVLPTGASSVRFGPENTILDPDWPRDRPEWTAYERWLRQVFGTKSVTVLHTRDRSRANSEEFTSPIRAATAVFLGTGNAGRYASAYLGTRTQQELKRLLDRGGVIMGSSAGSIILGSFVVRGRPDKPLLMAKGHTKGFGFLQNVAINPHLTSAMRHNELVTVCDEHPTILGLGLDDEAALVVRGNKIRVIGRGRVAVYENRLVDGVWYSWLKPDESFDLNSRKRIP